MALVSTPHGSAAIYPHPGGGVVVQVTKSGVTIALTLTLDQAAALRAALNDAIEITPPRQKELQP